MAEIVKTGRQISVDEVASNSLAITSGDLVSLSGGFVIKATTSGKVVGISKTTKTFAADNQTVAKAKVVFVPGSEGVVVKLTADATITQADVGKFYNLNANQTVDVATVQTVASYVNTSDAGAAVDAVINMQLELVKFIDATTGEFRLV